MQDGAIVKSVTESLVQLTDKDIQTLISANIIPKNTPQEQISVFARVCHERNLSPFSKQIYLMSRNTKDGVRYTYQTSIDGFRSLAERTSKYAGSDDYIFDDGLTVYQMLMEKRNRPTTATATVHKLLPNGQTFPIKATARWTEYYPGDKLGFMWDKMPFLMLGKCAEALALRKAFPEQLGSIYVNEEMQQAEIVSVETVTEERVEKQQTPIENLTEKYEKIFAEKTPEEIKDIYSKLPKSEQGKGSIAQKMAVFYKEKYVKEHPEESENLTVESLIIRINEKTTEAQLKMIDDLISKQVSEKRAQLIQNFQTKLDEHKINYEIQSLPF
jgi:phage recombination protein Bet